MIVREFEKRRLSLDFDASVAVRFGDGQEWFVPKPWAELRPVMADGRVKTFLPRETLGPDADALIEAMAESVQEQDEPFEKLSLASSLAARMLRVNYELSDADLASILCVRLKATGEPVPESFDWLGDVVAVATGRSGPKRLRGGGD